MHNVGRKDHAWQILFTMQKWAPFEADLKFWHLLTYAPTLTSLGRREAAVPWTQLTPMLRNLWNMFDSDTIALDIFIWRLIYSLNAA